MRKAKGVLGVIAGLMLLFHAGGTPAVASDQLNSPPGNNGTIKIHEGASEQDPIQANDPYVCTFHIHGFNFDSNATGTWRLEQQAPTGDAAMGDGTWTADSNGDWRTAVITLPNGHYQAHASQTTPVAPGGEKTKTFLVECGQSATGGTTTTTTGGTTGSSGGSSGGGTTGGEGGATSGGGTTGGEGGATSGGSSSSTTGGATSGGSSSSTGGGATTGSTGGATSGGTGTSTTGSTGGATSGGTGTSTTGSTGGNTGNGAGGATTGGSAGGQGNVNTTSGEAAAQGESPSEQILPSTSLQNLPSTSTAGDSAPLTIFGGLLVAFGAFLLRRTPGQSR